MTQPILRTDRLILEPFKRSDANDVFQYANDSDVAKFVTWEAHKTVDDSHSYLTWIEEVTSSVAEKIFYVWAIREINSGKVIGTIDFKNSKFHSGQFDYALGRAHWNRGLATEAAKEVLDWAFREIPNLVRVQSFCLVENFGSRRVMEKSGLEFEGVRRRSIQVKGKIVDTAHYALVK